MTAQNTEVKKPVEAAVEHPEGASEGGVREQAEARVKLVTSQADALVAAVGDGDPVAHAEAVAANTALKTEVAEAQNALHVELSTVPANDNGVDADVDVDVVTGEEAAPIPLVTRPIPLVTRKGAEATTVTAAPTAKKEVSPDAYTMGPVKPAPQQEEAYTLGPVPNRPPEQPYTMEAPPEPPKIDEAAQQEAIQKQQTEIQRVKQFQTDFRAERAATMQASPLERTYDVILSTQLLVAENRLAHMQATGGDAEAVRAKLDIQLKQLKKRQDELAIAYADALEAHAAGKPLTELGLEAVLNEEAGESAPHQANERSQAAPGATDSDTPTKIYGAAPWYESVAKSPSGGGEVSGPKKPGIFTRFWKGLMSMFDAGGGSSHE